MDRYHHRRHDAEIARRWHTDTMEAIAKDLGITRERVRQIGMNLGLPAHSIAVHARADERRQAKHQAKDERRQRQQQQIAQLRDLVENQGLSVLQAARQLGLSRSQAWYRAQAAGIVSMFGRWPQNKARARLKGYDRVPMPWHVMKGRKRHDADAYDAAIKYYLHPDGLVSFK
jgi:hypothetical protein